MVSDKKPTLAVVAADPEFEQFAVERRRWQDQHQWRGYTPSDEEIAAHESETKTAWQRELERRGLHEAKRVQTIADRFPRRALEAARGADLDAAALRQLRAWTLSTNEGIAVLAGVPGCGKTTAATWWALQSTYAPQFIRATDFAASSRYDTEARQRWQRERGLVLDDLGAEYADAKGSFRVDIDELVDVFYADKRALIITTNLTSDEFRARYGERIVDRLRECGSWLTINGPSLRRKAT